MKKINRIISDFIILTLSVLILPGCAQSTTQPGGEDINASSSENIDADKYTSKYFRKITGTMTLYMTIISKNY